MQPRLPRRTGALGVIQARLRTTRSEIGRTAYFKLLVDIMQVSDFLECGDMQQVYADEAMRVLEEGGDLGDEWSAVDRLTPTSRTRVFRSASAFRETLRGAPLKWRAALINDARVSQDGTWRAFPEDLAVAASVAHDLDRVTALEVQRRKSGKAPCPPSPDDGRPCDWSMHPDAFTAMRAMPKLRRLEISMWIFNRRESPLRGTYLAGVLRSAATRLTRLSLCGHEKACDDLLFRRVPEGLALVAGLRELELRFRGNFLLEEPWTTTPATDVAALGDALAALTALESLVLMGVGDGDGTATWGAISRATRLTRLSVGAPMYGRNGTRSAAAVALTAMSRLRHFETLNHFMRVFCNDADTFDVFDALARSEARPDVIHMSAFRTLLCGAGPPHGDGAWLAPLARCVRSLTMKGSSSTEGGAGAGASAAFHIAPRLTELTFLHLSDGGRGDYWPGRFDASFGALVHLRDLKMHLHWSDVAADGRDVARGLARLSALTMLEIYADRMCSEGGQTELARACASPRLSHVALEATGLGDLFAVEFARAMNAATALVEFKLGMRRDLTAEGICAVLRAAEAALLRGRDFSTVAVLDDRAEDLPDGDFSRVCVLIAALASCVPIPYVSMDNEWRDPVLVKSLQARKCKRVNEQGELCDACAHRRGVLA